MNLGTPKGTDDLLLLCDRLSSMPPADDAAELDCDVGRIGYPDADTLNGLARLQLAARRTGRAVRLRHASDELHGLLALAGLCDVVGVCPDLGLEAGGQAEEREHPGRVEEEGDPADPVA
ncbi:MAG: STAS domain-containing protein [Chloroflexota bacterium]|nr:STAS domain-containing protein [Chloroflexota bacterium]